MFYIVDDYIIVLMLFLFFFCQYDMIGWVLKEYNFGENVEIGLQKIVEIDVGSSGEGDGGVFQLGFVWDEVFGYYYDFFLGFYYDGN